VIVSFFVVVRFILLRFLDHPLGKRLISNPVLQGFIQKFGVLAVAFVVGVQVAVEEMSGIRVDGIMAVDDGHIGVLSGLLSDAVGDIPQRAHIVMGYVLVSSPSREQHENGDLGEGLVGLFQENRHVFLKFRLASGALTEVVGAVGNGDKIAGGILACDSVGQEPLTADGVVMHLRVQSPAQSGNVGVGGIFTGEALGDGVTKGNHGLFVGVGAEACAVAELQRQAVQREGVVGQDRNALFSLGKAEVETQGAVGAAALGRTLHRLHPQGQGGVKVAIHQQICDAAGAVAGADAADGQGQSLGIRVKIKGNVGAVGADNAIAVTLRVDIALVIGHAAEQCRAVGIFGFDDGSFHQGNQLGKGQFHGGRFLFVEILH